MATFKSKRPIGSGLGLLIIGLIFSFVLFKDFILSFNKPTAVADMTTAELTDGALVEDDIFAILDYFMYEETIDSKYGIPLSSYVSSYYYIIPVLTKDSEELYMALELSGATEDKIISICEDTLHYLYGDISEENFGYNTYHVTGPVRAMSEEEIQYMVEWFQGTEYFGTRDESVIRSYIHPVMIEKYNPEASRILTALGIFLVLIGIIYIITGIVSRPHRVKVSKEEPAYTPNNSYAPYQTGFIKIAAPEIPENTNMQNGYLNQQNRGYLNQQNNSNLNQQNNKYLNRQNNGSDNQPNNTIPNPSTNVNTSSPVDLKKSSAKNVSQDITPSHNKQADTKPKASSGLSDIFFKVDHK